MSGVIIRVCPRILIASATMPDQVENLVLVELGPEFVAEADFREFRLSVRCVYNPANWCWIYHVFIVDEKGLNRISAYPSRLRCATRLGAVHMGMQFAVNHILGIAQPPILTDSEFVPLEP